MTRFVTLSVSSRYACFAIIAILYAASLAGSRAQEASSDSSLRERQTSIIGVGIGDIYRPGVWTAIATPTNDQVQEIEQVTSVQSLDGDGVRVTYRQPNSAATSQWLYAISGSANAPLVLLDAENKELFRSSFAGKAIEPKTPWVVVIGDTLGIEDIGRNDLLNREASVAVSKIEASRQLPDHALGLSGVDLIVICPSGIETLKGLSEPQVRAIIDWTHDGGEVMISFGKNANEMLAAAPWLSDLLSLPKSLKPIRLDPSALETYTSSQSRLPVLDAVEFPGRGDNVLLAGRNESRQPARIAIKRAVGFGHAIMVAVAIDSPELADWPQRLLFVTRLSGELLFSELEVRRDSRSASGSVGYDDIAGQLRMALDRFELRRRIPYSIISIILIALVALIGPLDYLVVNRLFGRPLLGWITFPVSVLAISGLLVWMGQTPASEVANDRTAHINRIEIVDIDAKSATPSGRGWSWAHLSSIDALKSDYPASLETALIADSQTASVVSAPFGHPGPTFGGISIAGEDSRLPAYDVLMSQAPNGSLFVNVKNIPLASGGSKGIVSQWRFEPKLSGKSKLSRRRGSELLEGSLTNPMSVDLLNGALVFGEWVYLLPTRLRAGQTIDNVDSLRQKNFRWLLARREALENSSRSEPWNPEMNDDFPRLAEILMFDSVAGGKDYTGLSNRPLSRLDLGGHLNQETAILFGQLESPALDVNLPVQRASSSSIRIILNVDLPRVARTP